MAEQEKTWHYAVSRLQALLADGKQRKAAVLTFGCQQNEADSEKMRGILKLVGYTMTDDAMEADLILINTCAIREHAEKRALSTVGQMKHCKAMDRQVMIGVCGCMMAETHRVEEIRKRYPYVDFTVSPALIHTLPEIILTKIEEKRRLFLHTEETLPPAEGIPVDRSSSYRAYVSIMYGCNNFCSYCIVPYVRGRERSRDSAAIIKEVEELVLSGYKDITLLGQNVNSYRGDCDFAELLARLDQIPGDYLLRFMTSHPKDVSDRLIETMANGTHIARQFHLPVQSGSDPILKAMNRHYTLEKYMATVKKLRAAMPDIVLTSDIIVAFPGESDADFQNTLSLLENVEYDMIYSFIYSPREGTPAARMEEQIPSELAVSRMTRLLNTQDEIARRAAARYQGRVMRILSDGASKEKKEVYSGRTEGGRLVHFTASTPHTGEFIYVRINRAEPFALYGEIIEK